jgi:heptosyltransferase I
MTPISFAQSPRKILIIKPSAIGDVVHTLPILKLVRTQFPKAHITWLVTPQCASLLEEHPLLDEVLLFERRRFGAGWRDPKAAAGIIRFARDLRAKQFDLVLDLQGLFRSGWMAWQTGAPIRVGFANAREFAWAFYTHRVPIATMEQHAIERYLTLAETIGCPRGPVDFTFNTDDATRQSVTAMLSGIENFAVLLPGTNWETKRWPVEKFAAMAKSLRERFSLKIITVGGPDDVQLSTQIPADLDLTAKTTLRQLVALLEKSSLVVANDSGPMHIASALGKPLVVPFGPTNPIRTGPYARPDSVIRLDIPCSPCYSRRCSHQSCLKMLEVEPVTELALQQVGKKSGSALADPEMIT